MKRPFFKRIKYALIYYFIKFLLVSAGLMPRGAWLWICGGLGKIAYYFMPETRNKTRFHITMAYGKQKSTEEIYDMTRRVFIMLGKNAGDTLRSFKVVKTLADLEKFLTTHGLENYEKAIAKGKGVIFLTNHIGAFELQSSNMSLRGIHAHIIGTALKDERLNQLLQNHRGAYGSIAIERGKESIRLFKALKQGGSIAILIDQDTQVQSVFVDFFEKPASTPIGAAVLTLRSGAAVIPTYIYLDKNNRQHMHLLPEVEVERSGDEEKDILINTQKFTSVTEHLIRLHPTQWVWMHERWKTKMD